MLFMNIYSIQCLTYKCKLPAPIYAFTLVCVSALIVKVALHLYIQYIHN